MLKHLQTREKTEFTVPGKQSEGVRAALQP